MLSLAGLLGREKEPAANLSGAGSSDWPFVVLLLPARTLSFLDEPTSGVSPTSRRMFFNIIQELAGRDDNYGDNAFYG